MLEKKIYIYIYILTLINISFIKYKLSIHKLLLFDQNATE